MIYTLPVFVNTVESATPDYQVPYSQTLTGGVITIASDADKNFKKLTVGGVDYALQSPYTATGVKVSEINIDVKTGAAYAITWSGYKVRFQNPIAVGSGQITATFAASCVTVLTAAGCQYEAEGLHEIFPGLGSEQGDGDFYDGELTDANRLVIKNTGDEAVTINLKINGENYVISSLSAGAFYRVEFNGQIIFYGIGAASTMSLLAANAVNKIMSMKITDETIPTGVKYFVG